MSLSLPALPFFQCRAGMFRGHHSVMMLLEPVRRLRALDKRVVLPANFVVHHMTTQAEWAGPFSVTGGIKVETSATRPSTRRKRRTEARSHCPYCPIPDFTKINNPVVSKEAKARMNNRVAKTHFRPPADVHL